MSENLEQKTPKKYKPSYIFAVISIAMILFLVGLFACSTLFVQREMNKIKESVQVDINLKEDVTDAQKTAISAYLKKQNFISKIEYVSKEVAAEKFSRELGQNFNETLGYNPLYDAYWVSLKADFSNPEFIKDAKSAFLSLAGVQEVSYSELAIKTVGGTLQPITIGISILSIVLLVIAFFIIDNTIRLMMYSQRFSIRSMQLIGADNWFIIKPFIQKSVIVGVISAFIAIVGLAVLIYLTNYKFSIEILYQDFVNLSFLSIGLILFGIIISIISTYLAVNKYLKIKLDELY
ncbi:MAG TPA: permease-like cell division protein FtsX [Chitinophagales bacterium]|nr:permease-like cell division protein FtsX [Chitinophagales bacterium]